MLWGLLFFFGPDRGHCGWRSKQDWELFLGAQWAGRRPWAGEQASGSPGPELWQRWNEGFLEVVGLERVSGRGWGHWTGRDELFVCPLWG